MRTRTMLAALGGTAIGASVGVASGAVSSVLGKGVLSLSGASSVAPLKELIKISAVGNSIGGGALGLIFGGIGYSCGLFESGPIFCKATFVDWLVLMNPLSQAIMNSLGHVLLGSTMDMSEMMKEVCTGTSILIIPAVAYLIADLGSRQRQPEVLERREENRLQREGVYFA